MGKAKRLGRRREFSLVHPDAAAIDIGATMHMAAVGPDCDPEPVRSFGIRRSASSCGLVRWLRGENGGHGVDRCLLDSRL
jgi:hypothetical protein